MLTSEEIQLIKTICGERVQIKQIQDFPDYYITNTGDLFSVKYTTNRRVKHIKGNVDRFGYLKCALVRKGEVNRTHTKKIHFLVTQAFFGNRPPQLRVVRHLDGNKVNNNVTNLCYGTHKENGQDMINHGRSTKGSKNPRVKFTEEQIKEIRTRALNGELSKLLAAEYGTKAEYINQIRRGDVWVHTVSEQEWNIIRELQKDYGFYKRTKQIQKNGTLRT